MRTRTSVRSSTSFIVSISLVFLFAVQTSATAGECLEAVTPGPAPTAADCLAIAQTAVGLRTCELCVCDANGSGTITLDDSRPCLEASTHQAPVLSCPPCAGSSTVTASRVISSSTTSSTYYTTTSSTSTTVPVSPYSCTVQFSVTSEHNIGALQYDVSYAAAPGEFAGSGGSVQCVDLTGGISSFNDVDATRTLSGAVINIFGFATPTAVAQCNFNSSVSVVNTGDFPITVVDASQPDLTPIVPLPEMALSSWACNGNFVCGNGILEPGEQCDDGGTVPGDGCSANCQVEGCTTSEQCNDGAVCNGEEICVDGFCVLGTPLSCDDGNSCTEDLCEEPGNCIITPLPFGQPCDDGNACTLADHCEHDGECIGGPRDCSDGAFCNGTETCDPDAGCLPGTPPTCADTVGCTLDSCNEATASCDHVPVDTQCNDSNVCTDDSCNAQVGCVNSFDPTNNPVCVSSALGRMTGGGRFYFDADGKDGLTHAFRLMCDPAELPNRLRIVWRQNNQRYRFRLGNLRSAVCSDNPAIGPQPPEAGFDTYEGEGTGTLQFGRERQFGAIANWRFTDAGEPNTQDDVSELIVRDANGSVVLQVAAKLFVGNHQAHAR